MEKKHDAECEMKIGYQSCDCPRGVKTSGHTPGPWKIETDEDRDGAVVMDSENRIVASCQGCDIPGTYGEVSTDEAKTNAHLIAAAPELLEALKILVESETVDRRDYKFAEHVINKAEGR